jgi:hypothetical protein
LNIRTLEGEVAGGFRRLHNEELHKLYASPENIRVIKSRRMKRVGIVGRIGYKIIIDSFLLENLRLLRKPRRRWGDNIRTDLREIGNKALSDCRDQWRAVVNTIAKLRIPPKSVVLQVNLLIIRFTRNVKQISYNEYG